jgi:DNA-binding response OmpR family regulator
MGNKRMLLVAKRVDAKPFMPIFEQQGIEVFQTESFQEAEQVALAWKPGAIVFLVPVYWESILDFVKKIRADEEMKKTGILYIGKLIEGAELTLLQKYDVKTMALGPVPIEEMARFIYEMLPKW